MVLSLETVRDFHLWLHFGLRTSRDSVCVCVYDSKQPHVFCENLAVVKYKYIPNSVIGGK